MINLNKTLHAGNLTRDPELRDTKSGTKVASIAIAINRHWKDKDGNPQQETEFQDITAYGKQAETIGQYFKKGDPIFVEGRLKTEKWEDKDGNPRSKKIIILENFKFFNTGKKQEEQKSVKQDDLDVGF